MSKKILRSPWGSLLEDYTRIKYSFVLNFNTFISGAPPHMLQNVCKYFFIRNYVFYKVRVTPFIFV